MTIYHDINQEPQKKPKDAPVVWRPSVYGVLENNKNEWLMVQPTWIEKLDLPGGGIEVEESIHEGLKREFYEETGYKVEAEGDIVYIGESHFFHTKLGFCHGIILIYKVFLISDVQDRYVVNTFEDGDEIADIRWVNPKELREGDVSKPFWPFIESLKL